MLAPHTPKQNPLLAVVQSAGYAYRLKGSLRKRGFERGGPLQYLLLRYTQALITQMAQTAVCNQHHSVEQQLSSLRRLRPSSARGRPGNRRRTHP